MPRARKSKLKAKILQKSYLPSKKKRKSNAEIEPLPATFTLVSIFGLILTTVFTASGRVPLSWGVAFDVVFAVMFIASMISITPRPTELE